MCVCARTCVCVRVHVFMHSSTARVSATLPPIQVTETSVRNEGGSGGVNPPPPNVQRTLAFMLSRETQGGSPKPPPPNVKYVVHKSFKALLKVSL